jgi:hypothetical protein
MTIIEGVSNSGKSRLSIDLIKNFKRSMFFLLDVDHSSINLLKQNKIEYQILNKCHLMDIKYRILEKGGIISNSLDYVVIDSINLIKDNKSYTEKIKYLLEVEKDFNLKIITTMNILNNLDKIPNEIKNINGVNVIKVKKQLNQ